MGVVVAPDMAGQMLAQWRAGPSPQWDPELLSLSEALQTVFWEGAWNLRQGRLLEEKQKVEGHPEVPPVAWKSFTILMCGALTAPAGWAGAGPSHLLQLVSMETAQ